MSPATVTFTPANWDTPQAVLVTGVADGIVDEDVEFVINVGPASSADSRYDGLQVPGVTVTNLNTDLAPPGIFKDGFEQD